MSINFNLFGSIMLHWIMAMLIADLLLQ